jgi:electron transport complex protein RnfG
MTPEPRFRKILIPLLIIFFVSGILLAAVDKFTHDNIAKNTRDAELRIIDAVMPLPHDNDLHEDYIEFGATGNPGANAVTVFRARKNGKPVGVVFMPVTATGYSGNILLVIGIAHDGTLLGVHVLKHQETPGLGDRIESAKSGWINQFTGRSLMETPVAEWAVQADGGKFDQLSGATITSRGVVNAVRKTLEYYEANRDRLYLEHR